MLWIVAIEHVGCICVAVCRKQFAKANGKVQTHPTAEQYKVM